MRASYIRTLQGWNGDARLYIVSPPVEYGDSEYTDYVAVSAHNVAFSGPETYIFPVDGDGKVLNWGELSGSFRGGLDHRQALERGGYTVQEYLS